MIALEQAHIAPRVFHGERNSMLGEKGLQGDDRRHRTMVDGGASPVQHDGANAKRFCAAVDGELRSLRCRWMSS